VGSVVEAEGVVEVEAPLLLRRSWRNSNNNPQHRLPALKH
jgi:hypothetical protein